MAQTNHAPVPRRLTVEELRKFSGNENLSDEELDQQSLFLLEYSIVLYKAYQKLNKTSDNQGQTICEASPEIRAEIATLAKAG